MGLNYFTNPNAPKYIAFNVDNEGCTFVTTHSGEYVVISGTIFTSVSGNVIQISGQAVGIPSTTTILTDNELSVTSASGGVSLSSGLVSSLVMIASDFNSGNIYVGGSGGTTFPYVGHGLALRPGRSVSLNINNMAIPHLCAVVSGDIVSFMGIF
jgi:hypothetical protein